MSSRARGRRSGRMTWRSPAAVDTSERRDSYEGRLILSQLRLPVTPSPHMPNSRRRGISSLAVACCPRHRTSFPREVTTGRQRMGE
jgi:hypothetical protein